MCGHCGSFRFKMWCEVSLNLKWFLSLGSVGYTEMEI